jgi:D-hydroxyproline dehydrogenase
VKVTQENIVTPAGKTELPRAIVVGGGIVGLACAIELQRRGMETVLVERDAEPRGASWGNAGHIATEQVEPLASIATLRSFPKRLFWRGGALSLPLPEWRAWLPFGMALAAAARASRFSAGKRALGSMLSHAMHAWRRLLDRAGAPELLREDGHWIVWESPGSAVAGRARWATTDTGEARIRELTADELARIEALVPGKLDGGVGFEGSGQIGDLGVLAERLKAHFVDRGGIFRNGEAKAVMAHDSCIAVRLADGSLVAGDMTVIAAGADSAPLLREHGFRVPLIAERGYHIQSRVDERAWPEATPPIVFEDRSMIVTRFRSGLRAASFVEFASARRPPDRRKWARLRQHAAALGLPIGGDATEWMGARPTLPDYLPAIGRSATMPGLLYAFGHQHLGLTLAACTAEAIGALATGKAPPFDLQPFDLARFGESAR